MILFYLAVGGVLGTWARYGLGGWMHGAMGSNFPWGTLAVNLLGSFLLGVAIRGTELTPLSPELRGLVEEREALEGQVEALRARRGTMEEAAYERELERLLLDLARKSQEIREREEG